MYGYALAIDVHLRTQILFSSFCVADHLKPQKYRRFDAYTMSHLPDYSEERQAKRRRVTSTVDYRATDAHSFGQPDDSQAYQNTPLDFAEPYSLGSLRLDNLAGSSNIADGFHQYGCDYTSNVPPPSAPFQIAPTNMTWNDDALTGHPVPSWQLGRIGDTMESMKSRPASYLSDHSRLPSITMLIHDSSSTPVSTFHPTESKLYQVNQVPEVTPCIQEISHEQGFVPDIILGPAAIDPDEVVCYGAVSRTLILFQVHAQPRICLSHIT